MKKIKIAISGIGNRALPKKPEGSNWLGWAELIRQSEYFELVAAHDVSDDSLKRIVNSGYLSSAETFKDLDKMLKEVQCDAVIVANPAEFHAQTIEKALRYKCHLLAEKPFVNGVGDGARLIEAIKKAKIVCGVAQNWRCKDAGMILRETIEKGALGRVGHIFFRYVRNRENPAYPKYIFDEELPLLYAMGIHHLDLFKYITGDEYVSVQGQSFKPPWSLYKSDTGLNLFLKTATGISIIYSGTISSKNDVLPQESMIIEGERGTVVNESQWLEPPLWFYRAGSGGKIDLAEGIKNTSVREQYDIADRHILNNFHNSIIGKEKLICSAEDGFASVKALEASKIACVTGKIVYLERI